MAKVKIKILPGHGIGGVGSAGHEAWMDEDEAKAYEAEGYLEILDGNPKPGKAEPVEEEPAEDHRIMKPQARRRKA